jgi:hypothetical protein
MKLKSIIFAAMLAAGSLGAAHAATDNWTAPVVALNGGPTEWSIDFGHTHTVTGTFTDTYTFTYSGLPSTAYGFFLNIQNPVGDINFNWAKLDGTTIPAANLGPLSGSAFFNVPVSGTIELLIKGKTLDAPASYSGTLSVLTPVPEPTTYAMLLGGLALLGVAARRRNQS